MDLRPRQGGAPLGAAGRGATGGASPARRLARVEPARWLGGTVGPDDGRSRPAPARVDAAGYPAVRPLARCGRTVAGGRSLPRPPARRAARGDCLARIVPDRARAVLSQRDVQPARGGRGLLAHFRPPRLRLPLHARVPSGRNARAAALERTRGQALDRLDPLIHRAAALALPLHPEAGRPALDRAHQPAPGLCRLAPGRAGARSAGRGLATGSDRVSLRRCLHALARRDGVAQLPDALDGDGLFQLSLVAGLAPPRAGTGAAVHGFRARHPFPAGADAIGHDRREHRADL